MQSSIHHLRTHPGRCLQPQKFQILFRTPRINKHLLTYRTQRCISACLSAVFPIPHHTQYSSQTVLREPVLLLQDFSCHLLDSFSCKRDSQDMARLTLSKNIKYLLYQMPPLSPSLQFCFTVMMNRHQHLFMITIYTSSPRFTKTTSRTSDSVKTQNTLIKPDIQSITKWDFHLAVIPL